MRNEAITNQEINIWRKGVEKTLLSKGRSKWYDFGGSATSCVAGSGHLLGSVSSSEFQIFETRMWRGRQSGGDP